MEIGAVNPTPMIFRALSRRGYRTWVHSAAVILACSALMTAAAYIQVPFWPVKLSLQSFVAVMIGLMCGRRLGGAAILLYLLQGAIGFPVFQSGGGLAYIAGPTGGYLLGFLFAALTIGYLVEKGALTKVSTTVGAVAAGFFVLYFPGIVWLSVLFGWEKALAFGLFPFFPAEFLKLALVSVIALRLRKQFC